MPLTSAVSARLEKGHAVVTEIDRCISLTGSEFNGVRGILVFAALNVTREYQRAVLSLIAQEHFCSALALIRVSNECLIRLHWLIYCASEEKAHEIFTSRDATGQQSRKDDGFPGAGNEAQQVDRVLEAQGSSIKVGFTAMYRRTVNDFTHTGLGQLVNQFDENLRFRVDVADETLIHAIDQTTDNAARATMAFLNVVRRPDLLQPFSFWYLAAFRGKSDFDLAIFRQTT